MRAQFAAQNQAELSKTACESGSVFTAWETLAKRTNARDCARDDLHPNAEQPQETDEQGREYLRAGVGNNDINRCKPTYRGNKRTYRTEQFGSVDFLGKRRMRWNIDPQIKADSAEGGHDENSGNRGNEFDTGPRKMRSNEQATGGPRHGKPDPLQKMGKSGC